MANINVIANNLMAMNSQRMLGLNKSAKAQATEKLSSGYRINRAADDAAGLAISEKMRRQIRGLKQGTLNAQDGVSWVQTGDGALDTVHQMLGRMTELAVKSLNDTYSESDRAAMQLEFDQLQSEIDKVTDGAVFNEKNIFSEHEIPYYQFEGNVSWLQGQNHVISDGANDLTITYSQTPDAAAQTVSISVPAGEYTTQELIDEIDSALENAGLTDKGLTFEYTNEGTCNLNLEGGVKIDDVGGGLAYLLYDTYQGGSMGALIGTTKFANDGAAIRIVRDMNDELEFTIESLNGGTEKIKLKVPTDDVTKQKGYTRDELINWLNDELKNTTVRAEKYGSGIRLFSEDSIVTRFKGNMFKVENKDLGEEVFTSVFYDNVGYGTVNMEPGYFTGSAIIPVDARDAEHQFFDITASNNELRLQPNGSDTPVTLTIPEGRYSLAEMASKLNELFKANGIELSATVRLPEGGFQGLMITSNIEGLDSIVGIDSENSSAYETLFVKRVYNKYQGGAKVDYEVKSDKTASFTGGKDFNGVNLPLTIETGKNDMFHISVNNSSPGFNIELPSGAYNSVSEIANAINMKLQEKLVNAIKATSVGNRLCLIANNTTIKTISASAVGSNEGFNELFRKETYIKRETASGYGSVELNTKIPNPVNLDSSNNKLTVNVDGTDRVVELPTGNVTHDEIVEAINKELAPKTVTENITFPNVNAHGNDSSFSNHMEGKTTENTASYDNIGEDEQQQGSAGEYVNNTPAKITFDVPLPSNFAITDSNNQFQCNINGNEKSITLDNGSSYTPNSFKNMLQEKLNEAFGEYYGGVQVSLDGSNKLTLTAQLKLDGSPDAYEQPGGLTSISCDTTTSSFLKELHTVKEPAVLTLDKPLQPSIKINSANNGFTFTYTENSVDTTVDLHLGDGTYNRYSMVNEINRQLEEKNCGVRASLDNQNRLVLTTTQGGNEYKLSYDTVRGGTSVEALFGASETPAVATANQNIQDPITIDGSSSDFFMIVNNSTERITLDPGKYDRQQFVNMLNQKLNAIGMSASLDGNRIKYTSLATGSNASFDITYSGGGSAMQAIYGTTQRTIPGATASFTDDGRLKLDGTGGIKISVSPGNNSFQTEKQEVRMKDTSSIEGYHSSKKASIDGVDNISDPITIDEWNKNLNFTFYDNGSRRNISITLPEKAYSCAELEAALKRELDAAVGSDNKLSVTVTASGGVLIQAINPGSKNYMPANSFSGSFYDKVICKCDEVEREVSPQDPVNGTQNANPAYTVGRKDIRHNITEITTGVNDTLEMDLSCGGQTYPLSMKLDPGRYDGQSLVNMIQNKLNQALIDKHLEPDTIKATVGGINTGVVGSNDDDALTFQINPNVKLPKEGQYIIDGVGGNAAFSVFYQTDGDIKVAYVTGTKDVSKGITIPQGETELAFEVDGDPYSVQVPEGDHSPEELVTLLNDELKKEGAPVTAEIYDGKLRLNSAKYGRHAITNISGPAKQHLFFQENGELEGEDEIPIKLSSNIDDRIMIERPTTNTAFLGINSIAITRPKYARKALDRLKIAGERVSGVRSIFGSKQNRLEHAIQSNLNKTENTQAAESAIRDADMAKEMIKLFRANVLDQAGTAMLAHARQSSNGVMYLLQ